MVVLFPPPMLNQLKSSGTISHYLFQKSPAWRKSRIDATPALGRFSVQARPKCGPFDALSVVCLAPAPQEECFRESWHDSRRVAAPVTKTGRNISKGLWHGEERKTLEMRSQWCIAVA